jgi:hypothetical protein
VPLSVDQNFPLPWDFNLVFDSLADEERGLRRAADSITFTRTAAGPAWCPASFARTW